MTNELHEVSRLIGGLETSVRNLTATVDQEREVAATYRRDLREVIGSLSESVRSLAREVGEMRPAVADYVERRAMAAGALISRAIEHWHTLARLVALAFITFTLAFLVRADDSHDHPPQDEALHLRFYATWMRPDAPHVSCCDRKDCYPTSFRQVGSRWEAQRREDGQWLPIPPEKFETRRDSPDGRNHVCMQAPGHSNTVFCAITGSAS